MEFKTKGDTAFRSQEYAQAVHHYSQAIEANGSMTNVLSNRAMCYMKLGKWLEAVRDCKIGLAQVNTESEPVMAAKLHHRMGLSCKQVHQLDECKQALAKARELYVAQNNTKAVEEVDRELKTLAWADKKAQRSQKFSMHRQQQKHHHQQQQQPKESDNGDLRGKYVPVQRVDELPAHLAPKVKPAVSEPKSSSARRMTSSFKAPDKLTNFAFTQLMRASDNDKPDIYRYVFNLDPRELVKLYRQGGINYDAIDFVLDAVIECQDDSHWLGKAEGLIKNGVACCARFTTTKLFTDQDKLNMLRETALGPTINEIF